MKDILEVKQTANVNPSADAKLTTAEVEALGGLNELSISGLQMKKGTHVEMTLGGESDRSVSRQEVDNRRTTSPTRVSPKKRKHSNEESPNKKRKVDASPSINSPRKPDPHRASNPFSDDDIPDEEGHEEDASVETPKPQHVFSAEETLDYDSIATSLEEHC